MSIRNTRTSRKARNARNILPLEHFTNTEQQKNLSEAIKVAENYKVIDAYLDNYQHRCHHHIKDKFFTPTAKKKCGITSEHRFSPDYYTTSEK